MLLTEWPKRTAGRIALQAVGVRARAEEKNAVAAEENGADRDCIPVFTGNDRERV